MSAVTLAAAGRRPRLGRAAMMLCSELVHVTQDEFAVVPQAFQWRGRRYRVMSVEGNPERHNPEVGGQMLRVRTESGLICDLEHRAGANVWMMRRVLNGREAGTA